MWLISAGLSSIVELEFVSIISQIGACTLLSRTFVWIGNLWPAVSYVMTRIQFFLLVTLIGDDEGRLIPLRLLSRKRYRLLTKRQKIKNLPQPQHYISLWIMNPIINNDQKIRVQFFNQAWNMLILLLY